MDNDATVNANGVNDTKNNTPGNVNFSGTGPQWLQIAKGEIGQKEYKGGQSNPRIVEYHSTVGLNASDSTPWCSSFVAWCLKKAGQSISGATGMARSWTSASCVEKIDSPLHGCIAVFSRGGNGTSGHVGFVDAVQGGTLIMVHGNSNDSVRRSGVSTQRLVGFYWPKGASKAGNEIPTSDEKVETGGRQN